MREHDADADDLQSALSSFGDVTVSRTDRYDAHGGRTWTITFAEEKRRLTVMDGFGKTSRNTDPRIDIGFLYFGGSVVRFPDAQDCKKDEALCYRLPKSVSGDSTVDPIQFSKTNLNFDDVDNFGRCRKTTLMGECRSVKATKGSSTFSLRTDRKEGKIMNVPAGRGWGGCGDGSSGEDTCTSGETPTYQFSDGAEVRVRIFLDRGTPSWSSGWKAAGRQHEWRHNVLGVSTKTPERVKVVLQVQDRTNSWCGNRQNAEGYSYGGTNKCNDMQGFYFDGTGSEQGANTRKTEKIFFFFHDHSFFDWQSFLVFSFLILHWNSLIFHFISS